MQCRHCNHTDLIDLAPVTWPRQGLVHALRRVLYCAKCLKQSQETPAGLDQVATSFFGRSLVPSGSDAVTQMKLTLVDDQAIAARIALIVGAETFDRLFQGVRFGEIQHDILVVYAKDEQSAAEIEETFALHISIIVSGILKRRIAFVMVLPRELAG